MSNETALAGETSDTYDTPTLGAGVWERQAGDTLANDVIGDADQVSLTTVVSAGGRLGAGSGAGWQFGAGALQHDGAVPIVGQTAIPFSDYVVHQSVAAGHTYDNATSVVFAGAAPGHAAQELLVDGLYDNSGTVLLFGGTGTPAGPGARLLIDAGGTVDNTGLILVSLTGLSASLLDLGLLTDAGTIADMGAMAIGADGTLAVSRAGTLLLDLDQESGTLSDAGVLINAGTLTVEAGHGTGSYAIGTGQPGAMLIVQTSGTLVNAGLLTGDGAGGQAGRFQNDESVITDLGKLENSGTIVLAGGGAAPAIMGAFRGLGGPGALLTISQGASLENSGTIAVDSGSPGQPGGTGGMLRDAGVMSNTGTISVFSGPADVGYEGSDGTAGHLLITSTGKLENDGALSIAGSSQGHAEAAAAITDAGLLVNQGRIAVEGGTNVTATFAAGANGAQLTVLKGASLINTGTIAVSGGAGKFSAFNIPLGGMLVDSGRISDTGAIMIAGGPADGGTLVLSGVLSVDGYLQVSGKLADTGTLSGDGTVRIGGTLATGAGAMVAISVGDILNDGVVNIGAEGLARIEGGMRVDPGQTGLVELGAHSTLSLGSTVAAAQSVLFGVDTALLIAHSCASEATLSGFAQGDLVDVRDVLANAVSFSRGVLRLDYVRGGSTADVGSLHLIGNYSASQFALAADGHGGTVISTAAPLQQRVVRQEVAAGTTFDNERVTTVTGTSAGSLAQELAVSGVYVNADTLALTGGSVSPGVGGSLLINAGGTVENTNVLMMSSSKSPGSMTILGLLTDTGTMAGAGSVEIAPGGLLAVASAGMLDLASAGGTLSDAGVLTNAGTLTIDGGSDSGFGPSFTGEKGALLTVLTPGTLVNSGLLLATGASPGFQSFAGTASTITDAGILINSGTIVLQQGGPGDGNGSATPSAALLSVAKGARLDNSGSILVERRGLYAVREPGATLVDAGRLINTGTISMADPFQPGTIEITTSGTLVNQGLLFFGSSSQPKDVTSVADAGILLNQGRIVLASGTISGSGSAASVGAVMTVLASGSLANSGTLTVEGAAVKPGHHATGGTLVDSGTVSDSGTIVIAAGPGGGGALLVNGSLAVSGMLSVDSFLLVSGTVTDTGTLSGDGTVRVGGTLATGADATVTISVGDILNDRLISIGAGGVARIERGIFADAHQTGTIALGAGSALSLGSTVTAAEAVAFGAGASLAIAHSFAFGATLAGFAKGDSIDLRDVLANTASFAGGVLTLAQVHAGITAEVARLTLAGAYASAHFALAADGHGGTVVTTTATLAAS